jgi:hypothetical protein
MGSSETKYEEPKLDSDFKRMSNAFDDTYNNVLNDFSDTLTFEKFDSLPPEYDKFKEQTHTALASIIRWKRSSEKRPIEVPTQIMYNHLHYPSHSPYNILPNKLVGPISITILRDNENQKTFYLFGDIHTKYREPSIDYFHNLVPEHLGQLDKLVDVFYEYGFHKHKKFGLSEKKWSQESINRTPKFDYLEEFAFHLKTCEPEYLEDGLCRYGNIRVHVADARQTDPFDPIVDIVGNFFQLRNPKCLGESSGGFMGCMMKWFVSLRGVPVPDDYTCKKIIGNTIELFKTYKNINIDDSGVLFRNVILKQISMIPDKELAEKLESYTDTVIDKLYKYIDQIYRFGYIPKRVDRIKDPRATFFKIFYNHFAKGLTDTATEIQDIYFIARCYREFNVRKDRLFPAVPCKNIVAYFGDFHIDNIVRLLTSRLKHLDILYRFQRKIIAVAPNGSEYFENPDYSPLQIPWFGKNLLKRVSPATLAFLSNSFMEEEKKEKKEKKDTDMELEEEI